MFFNVCLHSCLFPLRACFHFLLIGGNLTAQLKGSHRGNGGGIQIPEMQLRALRPFPTQPPEHPGQLARRLKFLVFKLLYKVGLGLFFERDVRHSLELKM